MGSRWVPRTAGALAFLIGKLDCGDAAALHPRGPRLDFDEVCRLL